MASKKAENKEKPNLLKELAIPGIKALISGYFTQAIGKIEHAIEETERKVQRGIVLSFLFSIGIVFLFIAAVFLIEEFTALSFGLSFLAVGFVLLFVCLIMIAMNKK